MPKFLTGFTFPFTYDYYRPVLNGTNVEYVLDHSDNALIVQGGGGLGLTLICHRQLGVGGAVRNLVDSKNTPLLVTDYGDSYDLYVNAASAEIGATLEVVGWRHLLRREKPRDFNSIVDGLAATING